MIRLWGIYPATKIGRIMGLSPARVAGKAKRLELPDRPHRMLYEPRRADWIRVVSAHAKAQQLAPREVMAGRKFRPAVIARWRAFQQMLDEFPNMSMAGLGRVSGFDHTSILHGLRRINGKTAQETKHGKATGRRPALLSDSTPSPERLRAGRA